jgi:hypothetical protein
MEMADIGTVAAALVIASVGFVSVRAWRQRPGEHALNDFKAIWQSGPWAKQLLVDFIGLEIVLVLWMAVHASGAGTWLVFAICVVLMPIFGSMAAAAYWLLAVAA